MAVAQRDLDRFVHVFADLFHLVQRRSRRHKGKCSRSALLQLLAAQRQSKAVHGNHSDLIFSYFKQRPHMYRPRLVRRNGKARLLNELAQRFFRQGDRVLLLDRGQLRKVLRRQPDDIEVGVAAAHLHGQLVIRRQRDRVVRHTADNVAEQPRAEHQLPLFFHIAGKLRTDAELHVIARYRQRTGRALQQKTLQRRDGALRCDCARGSGNGVLQNDLFTGEFHSEGPFLKEKSDFL